MSNFKKFDNNKTDLTLADPLFIDELCRVLELGVKKYGRDNWKSADASVSRLIAAIKRHTAAIELGEWVDPESGLSHTAHIAAGSMFLRWHKTNGTGINDLQHQNSKGITQLQKEIVEWADTIFPDRTVSNALTKLVMEEIPEVLSAPDDASEFADVLILVLDAAYLAGVDIFDAVERKMAINRARIWEKTANGLMHHVRMKENT